MIGQVATTIIVAQTVAPANGSNTHRLATMRSPMEITLSVVRVRSVGAGSRSIPSLNGSRTLLLTLRPDRGRRAALARSRFGLAAPRVLGRYGLGLSRC